jgi:hypothetical protein
MKRITWWAAAIAAGALLALPGLQPTRSSRTP